VRRYPVAESQGLVFIWMAGEARRDAEPSEPAPTFPGVVGGAPKLVDRMAFDSHIDHAVVGLMDPAHGPYVHQQWWWRSARSQHEKAKRFEPRDGGFAMVRHEPSKNSRAYALLGGEPLTEISFRLPGLRWEHVTVGKRQVLSLTCLTPVHATKTRITQIIWSDHPAFVLLKPLIAAGARAFLRQDGEMVNLQNEGLKYDPALLWIDDADRQAKWYQQLKREWTASRREGRSFVNPVEPATLRWRS
jgi:phenylpropionate dioxygenase-like ring-hydroxylating dioxygenase large terminal subunit